MKICKNPNRKQATSSTTFPSLMTAIFLRDNNTFCPKQKHQCWPCLQNCANYLRIKLRSYHLFLKLINEFLSWRLEIPLQDLELCLVLESLVLQVVDDVRRARVDLFSLLLAAGRRYTGPSRDACSWWGRQRLCALLIHSFWAKA